jgi:hypothetical protein
MLFGNVKINIVNRGKKCVSEEGEMAERLK